MYIAVANSYLIFSQVSSQILIHVSKAIVRQTVYRVKCAERTDKSLGYQYNSPAENCIC